MLLQKLILGFAAQVQAHVLINGTRIKDLTLGTVFPLPPCPLTRENALKILRIGLQLGEVWHGEPEHGILPTLRGSQYISDVARSQVNRAHNAIARVELKPPGAVAMRPADEEKFWRAWGGKEMYHSSRPIVVVRSERLHLTPESSLTRNLQLMWNTESSNQAYAYIASVGERMLRCSASIGSISLSLYVGWRDWKSATTWQRAKVRRPPDYLPGRS